MTLIIAIDGPAASGKGTLSRMLADNYELSHLDTGLTYRALGLAMMKSGLSLDDPDSAVVTAKTIDLANLDRTILSAHDIGEAASKVAVIPQVRKILVEKQREFASQPGGAVLDGRDIGTVVCPNATVKLYVFASSQVRAKRRFDEEASRSKNADFDLILADIERRDARDMGREDSPLRPASDAHLLDTTDMSIDTAFAAAVKIIDQIIAAKST